MTHSNLKLITTENWRCCHIQADCESDGLTKYFSPGSVLRDEVEHTLGLHHLVELHDVGMVDQLHHLNLPVHLAQVGWVQLGLVDNLDGHL